MENILKIKSRIDTFDELSFSKILNKLDSIGQTLEWSMLEFEAMGDLSDGKSILEFEDEINTSSQGKLFSWVELKDISLKIRQVIFMSLIGTKSHTVIDRSSIEKKNYKNIEIAINVIDGYLWEIFIKDTLLFKKIKESFL